MKDKDRQLLLIDLCGRLPYEVKGLHRGEIQRLLIMDSFGSYQVNGYDAWFDLNSVIFKPYLRPISSMTEEEKEEFNNLFNASFQYFNQSIISASYLWDRNEAKFVGTHECSKLIDWLNAHHFDYRGLIEKGLALEMPKDMYK